MMARCLLVSGSDERRHFSTENRHAVCHKVNLCSCQHFLHLEIRRRAQRTCLCDALGHNPTRKTQSKYSHKLTKVDIGTDVFDKFAAFVHV